MAQHLYDPFLGELVYSLTHIGEIPETWIERYMERLQISRRHSIALILVVHTPDEKRSYSEQFLLEQAGLFLSYTRSRVA